MKTNPRMRCNFCALVHCDPDCPWRKTPQTATRAAEAEEGKTEEEAEAEQGLG